MDPDALDVVPLITQCDELGADGESLLRVDDAGVALLEALGGEKVSVVAVAGMYRTGKSFFLNRLAGAAGARSGGFGVGETTEPCTRGVWLWRSPGLRAADGSTLLLMDTEGLASADQDDSYDAKIFALALLLSSYFVLNVVGVIDDATIERLHLVSEVTKRVVVEGEPTVDDEDEAAVLDRSAAALAAHFPPLLVLVRDFALKPTRDGQPITDAEYLEDALRDRGGDAGDNKKALRHARRDAIRRSLRTLFPAGRRACATLGLYGRRSSSATPRRRRASERKIVCGAAATGASLAALARLHVASINAGAAPSIRAPGTRPRGQRAAADDAEKCYDDHVASRTHRTTTTPRRGAPEIDDPAHGAVEDRFAVYEVHKDGAKKAMARFDGAACDGPDRPARRKKLRVALDRAGKRFRERLAEPAVALAEARGAAELADATARVEADRDAKVAAAEGRAAAADARPARAEPSGRAPGRNEALAADLDACRDAKRAAEDAGDGERRRADDAEALAARTLASLDDAAGEIATLETAVAALEADVAAKDDALGVLRRELRDAAAAAESQAASPPRRRSAADASSRAEDDASAAALRHGDALEQRDEALAAAAAGARARPRATQRERNRRQGGARGVGDGARRRDDGPRGRRGGAGAARRGGGGGRGRPRGSGRHGVRDAARKGGEEDEDDGEDRGRTAPRAASQPRSRSVGPMAAPDEPEAESTDDREAYKSSGVSTARRDLDQIPRSQRLQKRQKSPIGLSLVQLEEIGLLDYDEDERPGRTAPDAAPESAAPAAPEPPQADDAPPTSVSAPASPKRHASGSREPADAPGKQRTNGHRSFKASSSFVAQDKRRAARPRCRGGQGGSAAPVRVRAAPEGWAAPAKALGAAGPSSDLDDIVEHDDDDGELDAFEGPHETLEPSDRDSSRERPRASELLSSDHAARFYRDRGDDPDLAAPVFEPDGRAAPARRREPARRAPRAGDLLRRGAAGPAAAHRAARGHLRELVLGAAAGRTLTQIFAHFDRRVRKCFDARDLLEGLVDLGVGATLGDARALVRRFCRDAPDDASQLAVHLGDFAVFVDDPDHDAFERDVCEAVAKRLLLLPPSAPAAPPRRPAATTRPESSQKAAARALRAAFGDEPRVSRRAFARGLRPSGSRRSPTAASAARRASTKHDGRCSAARFAKMVRRSPEWRENAWLRRVRLAAAREADVACGGARAARWASGLDEALVEACRTLGLRVFTDADLAWIALDALEAPLPTG
ncbi:GTPase [Aureococcus anophagefferens]|nr:GTPase [Aureococcus anophagefferens]